MVWGFKRWLVRKKKRKTRREVSGWPLFGWLLLGFVLLIVPFNDWPEGSSTVKSHSQNQPFIQRSLTGLCRNANIATVIYLPFHDRTSVLSLCRISGRLLIFWNMPNVRSATILPTRTECNYWTVQTSFIEPPKPSSAAYLQYSSAAHQKFVAYLFPLSMAVRTR